MPVEWREKKTTEIQRVSEKREGEKEKDKKDAEGSRKQFCC